MSRWTKETVDPGARKWEEFYRNRFQHDKRVRTTHGVNCTGSCSWEVFVKDGIVTWELQATDYPELEEGLPPYEPRGCQRGISYSWYLYSPLRVKYPYCRGVLVDMYRSAKEEYLGDPIKAWASIQETPEWRKRYQQARGKGGFRRISWDEALEIAAASTIHTISKHGPDRVAGFSPIPAMSQVSYAAGSRFMSLIGGVVMSFYDWYCDLPPASPEIWGEQTDVHESADWFNARFIAVDGCQPQHDPHARHPLHLRGAPRRRQACRVQPGLHSGRQVRRLVDPVEPRSGHRVLDGRRPRAADRVLPRPQGRLLRELRPPVHRPAVPGRDQGRPAGQVPASRPPAALPADRERRVEAVDVG